MVHPDPQKRYQTIKPNISPIQTILNEIKSIQNPQEQHSTVILNEKLSKNNNSIFSPITSSVGVITGFLGIATSTAGGALPTFPLSFYSSKNNM
jgi:hypothetical protein